MLVQVFRSGPPAVAAAGIEAAITSRVDRARPAGRVGRQEGVFCAMDLRSLARWTFANCLVAARDADVLPCRLTVHTSGVYVYPVDAWERVSSRPTTELDSRYWDVGLPVTEWTQRLQVRDPLIGATENWEAIVPMDNIATTIPESAADVLDAMRHYQPRNLTAFQTALTQRGIT